MNNTKFNKIIFPFYIGLSIFCNSGHAQNDSSLLMDEKIQSFQKMHFIERLFVHTDKSFYVAGEHIWMKFYLTDALLHKPSQLSKLVYVELIDKNNKSVWRNKFQIDSGFGDGAFVLSNQFLTGNYTLRAYTQWMRNEGQNTFFEQVITIVNTIDEIAKPPNTYIKPRIDFHFFPEGGNLIDGIESKIAFKAINEFEQGIDCNGFILNNRNDTVVKFSSFKMGMGNFMFKPIPGEQYKAIVKAGDSIINPSLPKIHAAGYSFYLIDNQTDSIFIKINKLGSAVDENLYLLHHGSQYSRKSQVQLTNAGQAYFKISIHELKEGMNRFTTFNSLLKPVCERSYFNFPKHRLSLNINSSQDVYEKRANVKLALKTNGEMKAHSSSNLSMSVFLVDSMQAPYSIQDIESYLHLTKELNGVVESPSFYFDATKISNTEKKAAIDNLMLTQGWSSYKWDDVFGAPKPNVYLPELEGPLVHANITYKKNNIPAKQVMAYFSVPGNPFYFASSKSNQNGEIIFNLKSDIGANEAILQAKSNIDTTYNITIKDPFETQFSNRIKKPFPLLKEYKLDLLKRSIASQAENIFDKNFKNVQTNIRLLDTMAFFGMPTNTYFLDDYTRFTSMEELTLEYIQEVKIKKKGIDFSISLWNNKYNIYNELPPFMMIDGVPIFNANKLFAFDPLKIKKIDIIARTNLSGSMFNNGIINYSTYNGDLANFPIDENALVMEYMGAQPTKYFYSPTYPTIQRKNSSLPDLRNVLLWEPNIYIHNNIEKQIDFYSADLPGKYAIVVQGLSSDGLLGSSIKYITVK